jgi:hypothetical protein
MSEALPPDTRVERINSPLDSLVKDGACGVVLGDPLQAENGTLGYFVRFAPGAPGIFCAGSRLKVRTETEAVQ